MIQAVALHTFQKTAPRQSCLVPHITCFGDDMEVPNLSFPGERNKGKQAVPETS